MINYDTLFSNTLKNTKPSGIRKFFDLLADMGDVTALTVGQPDFVTPYHIREAAIESLEEGKTYYTANAGTKELREEISSYLSRRFGLSYDAKSEVFVTVGGSEAIDVALRSFINPGDEVIIPTPTFVCYEPLAKMAGATPVIINCRAECGWKLTADELREKITDKTKMLVLPYPNNPTGAVLDKEELEAIAEVLRGTNIIVLSDEIYAELTYGKRHISIASIEGMRERTIIASGFSKAYAMTGWRLGYLAAPKEILSEMLKLHQYAIMCAPTASQFAGREAMREGDADVEYMRAEYNRRRLRIYEGLKEIGIDSVMPEGAFYIFPYIGGFGLSSEEFCE
ncbi:MAG: aminotransferase class I/II-fold pyridoxal phosphate-dependent enzyme, partial [Clostridia bacterium]|nr:aminotransferase class I/II-fold pyridoxal phosphate-dependent enzyme [Clostridia bacterium]